MFRKLFSEAYIEFMIKTESPLFIKYQNDVIDPTAEDATYIHINRNNKRIPILPGTSMKGVFRSYAERILPNSCNILSYSCAQQINTSQNKNKDKKPLTVYDIYHKLCPTCKLFGSTLLKSRILFDDSIANENFIINVRSSTPIDRISGAAKQKGLNNFEYVEYAEFPCKIKLINFFNWQVHLLIKILDDINDGFVTFGGLTSKGFGRMKVENVSLKIKYYKRQINGYINNDFYCEKEINDMQKIKGIVGKYKLDDSEFRKDDLQNEPNL